MKDYVIFTDSACDISPAILADWGVRYRNLTFRFNDSEKEYSNEEMDAVSFYAKMREGGIAKTAAVNADAFASDFEAIINEGKDVLYLGFSSGLSTTFNSARIAAGQLKEKYPDAKIEIVDTLAASAGQGLIVYLTVEEKKKGASIEEATDFAKGLIPRMGIWFTVDDLVYLKRGGRVSPTAAFVGNLLGIKPVLYMDDAGHLIPVSKVRGRRTAITAMADKYTELAACKESGSVFISHGDCEKDAQLLADMLKECHGIEVQIITNVGPVIGAHSGPGTLALFFVGNKR
jgi:DegV family protein with EDD domain